MGYGSIDDSSPTWRAGRTMRLSSFKTMARWACVAVLAAGARQSSAGDCEAVHDPRYVYSAEIVRVYDGDTIYVDIDLGFRTWLRDEPLRLWGVDTPEVRGDEKAEGLKVRDLVASWLPVGSEVLLRTLKDKDGDDRTGTFHRYLAIICPEGWSESVNARLLRQGHAVLEASSQREEEELRSVFSFHQ